MVCHHLRGLEKALKEAGFTETSRGQAWSRNCREWVYFNVVLDIEKIRLCFTSLPAWKYTKTSIQNRVRNGDSTAPSAKTPSWADCRGNIISPVPLPFHQQ